MFFAIGRHSASLLLGVIVGTLVSPQCRADGPAPTDDQFALQVERLVDNCEDIHLYRFAVTTKGKRTISFRHGTAGFTSGARGNIVKSDAAGQHRFEAILLLRIQRERSKGEAEPEEVVSRLLKFGRSKGSSVESSFPAPKSGKLQDVTDIQAQTGLYRVGEKQILGRVLDQQLTLQVE